MNDSLSPLLFFLCALISWSASAPHSHPVPTRASRVLPVKTRAARTQPRATRSILVALRANECFCSEILLSRSNDRADLLSACPSESEQQKGLLPWPDLQQGLQKVSTCAGMQSAREAGSARELPDNPAPSFPPDARFHPVPGVQVSNLPQSRADH